MRDIHIIHYSVRGIKNLEEWLEIPFFKKGIDKNFNIHKYNVKGIYGANGAGKSAIISSLKILRNLITDPYYLSNNEDQEKIAALINRRTKKLEISVQFIAKTEEPLKLYEYRISVANENGRCSIGYESLSEKNATSNSMDFQPVYSVEEGVLFLPEQSKDNSALIELSKNLLKEKSLPSIFIEKIDEMSYDHSVPEMVFDLIFLVMFGANIFVFLDKEDKHEGFYRSSQSILSGIHKMDDLLESDRKKERTYQPRGFFELSSESMEVRKEDLSSFRKTVDRLFIFIRIFKNDLRNIEIEKREDRTSYHCTLKMIYDDYSVDAEFESGGIKKLIRLYAYINRFPNYGTIVNQLDSCEVFPLAVWACLPSAWQGGLFSSVPA